MAHTIQDEHDDDRWQPVAIVALWVRADGRSADGMILARTRTSAANFGELVSGGTDGDHSFSIDRHHPWCELLSLAVPGLQIRRITFSDGGSLIVWFAVYAALSTYSQSRDVVDRIVSDAKMLMRLVNPGCRVDGAVLWTGNQGGAPASDARADDPAVSLHMLGFYRFSWAFFWLHAVIIGVLLVILWRLAASGLTESSSPSVRGSASALTIMPPASLSEPDSPSEARPQDDTQIPRIPVSEGFVQDQLLHHKAWLQEVEGMVAAASFADPRKEWISNLQAAFHRQWTPNASLPPLPDPRLASMTPLQLRGAILDGMDLSFQDLRFIDFQNASMVRTNLTGADLRGANLTYATLREAKLTNADLTYAVMRPTVMENADMTGVIYQPQTWSFVTDIGLARNLDRMTHNGLPTALAQLEKNFRETGLESQARKIDAAMRRYDAPWLQRILFDWTCGYGSAPLRPFAYPAGTWALFTFGYFVRIVKASSRSEQIVTTASRIRRMSWEQWPQLRSAMLLSTRATFFLGFGDFKIGDVLAVMFPKKDEIVENDRWVRIGSGLQSIVSLCFILLGLACYFGNPFAV